MHRAISDIRNVAGRPAFVVVLTILPDAPQAEPISPAPFLMVAVSHIDETFLNRLGADFGFKGLTWLEATDGKTSSSLALSALNGSAVGELHWTFQRPGWELARRMTPGLVLAIFLLLSLAALLVYRNYKQAGSLENYSRKLRNINTTLEHIVSERTQELMATIDNMAQGIILLKDDGSVAISNLQALELLELQSVAELPREAAKLLQVGTDQAAESERRALPQQSHRRDYTRQSGRIVEVRQTHLAKGGIVVTISDVSALKRRQQELEAATRAATSASEAKSRFLSTMSHEMRTPLNGVIGALELISKTPLSEDQAQLVNIAGQSSDALLVHINDVLDFSKLEAGKLELDSKPFNLRRMILTVADITKSQAEHRKNEIVVDYPTDLPQHIVGDSVRLRQIILNFVSNANKFTRNGRISVRVRCDGGTAAAPAFNISVSDTGIGIPSNRLNDLFHEFSMLESEYTRNSGGTGLGLAISKRLIEAMDGLIWVESIEGEGSTFHIRAAFPLSADASNGTDSAAEVLQELQVPLDILLVDDNSTNRLIGRRLLEAAGHSVTTANNGQQAVAAAAAKQFDVILMDISMPEMDGREATGMIRKMPAPYSKVRIIALTANAVIGDREAFIAAGMDDYLSKPFRLADIVSKLASVTLNARQDSAQTASPGAKEQQRPILDEEVLAELAVATSDD
ncbi:MAG: response regulator, partial [Hyphomicrobium sp.]